MDKFGRQSDGTHISQAPLELILVVCNLSDARPEDAAFKIAQALVVAIDVRNLIASRSGGIIPPTDDRSWQGTVSRADTGAHPSVAPNRIHLDGSRFGRRLQIILNGKSCTITERSFELLLRLVVALFKDDEGWVHRSNLGDVGDQAQAISRLRSELRAGSADETKQLIENNGAGSYRLSILHANATVDLERLCNDSNTVISELALSLRGSEPR